jgi:hypothetical protein
MSISSHVMPFCTQVGIYLPRHISDHGKLYVAFSRVRRPSDIGVVIIPDTKQGYSRSNRAWFTINTVERNLWCLDEPPDEDNYVHDYRPPHHAFYHEVTSFVGK